MIDDDIQWCPMCGAKMHPRCFDTNGLCVDCAEHELSLRDQDDK